MKPRPVLALAALSAATLAWPAAAAAQTYLKASNTGSGDFCGWTVAASGDTVAVGALNEDSNAVGVNGAQSGNSAADSGAIYVFVTGGGLWSQQAYIKASNTEAGDKFSGALALSGDTLVVAAAAEDSGATVVNGNQADNGAASAGAVYVFVRAGGAWTQQAYLKAANAEASDTFGTSVAIAGNTLVVGAPGEDSLLPGVNPDPANNAGSLAGAAYVFVRSGTTWTQQAYLKASNPQSSDSFGTAVSVAGDTVVVGAPGEDSSATGVNGDDSSNGAAASGATYVFVRSGNSWLQQAYLKASNAAAGDEFGAALAMSGETIVVGAALEDSAATGVNGSQAFDGAVSAGVAYVFVRSGATWSQQAYLKASNTGTLDQFGGGVAIAGDRIVVGAGYEGSSATGVNGDGSSNAAVNAGAAYAFVRSGTTWTQQAYLKASNTQSQDIFGLHVAVAGDTVVAGAYKEDGSATGVNGNGLDNAATDSGAAYAFALPALSAWTDLGSGLAGVSGVPSLAGSGTLAAGSLNALDLSGAAPSKPAGLFVALASVPTPFKGGTLLAFPVLSLVVLATGPSGTLPLPFVMPAGVPAGSSLWVQWAIQDPAAVQGTALSNALRGVTP